MYLHIRLDYCRNTHHIQTLVSARLPAAANPISITRKTWFGNQLLVGMKRQSCMEGYASEVAVYDDVDFRDFRHALDYYQQHPANPCIVDSNRDRRPAIPGVILYCDGTQKRLREFGLDVPAEQVRIPRYQTMVLEESVCMRTLQLGLEWGYRRYEPNKEWHKKDINVINMYNDLATSFVQGVTGDMILTPLIYVGTVVLFDNRGAIIQPMHLIGIAAFLDSVANKAVGIELITQPMTKLWEPDPENKSKESQEELEKFWAEWQKDDSIEGFDKRTIVAPTRLKSTLDAEIVGGQFFADVRARLAARDKSGNKNAAA
ncbi:hypothetical protein BKA67DRAFT_210531 [Truncatella angustata]|uniref:Uncharacterized protein n=1 Tax=Truncatella angustata TaxID=152316 RepID=A0A9P8UU84_9PEZI|nr:uncharacterized protein BKA67DRAFT_210531 [Truncatella angustata]KAH6658299.1 hypothetical protein BKA67DRAFT_210531 [Truncatella angustata]